METELRGCRVLVTGASGFIGRRLVAALRDAGAEVTALTRSRAAAAALPPGVRPAIGALGDGARLRAALAGQEILFNLAYDLRAPAAENLAGFEALVAAAEATRPGRIVHASSIVVHDAWPDGDCDAAGRTDRPGGGPYRQAKIAMERRLMAGALPAVILRPTIVWGPGSAQWTDRFARALMAGGVVIPEPEGICNGVFVDDVVQAFLRAATLADPGREAFVISGPEPFAWSALIDGYAAILGTAGARRLPAAEIAARLGPRPAAEAGGPPLAARISARARRLIGHRRFEALVGAVRGRIGGGGPLLPDHHLLEEMTGRGICRIDHARARLGYAPQFDLARGLAATADHLRALRG